MPLLVVGNTTNFGSDLVATNLGHTSKWIELAKHTLTATNFGHN